MKPISLELLIPEIYYETKNIIANQKIEYLTQGSQRTQRKNSVVSVPSL